MDPETLTSDSSDGEMYQSYRALSSTAVASLICGLLAPAAIFGLFLAFIPVLGILLGIYALVLIRQRSDELTGGRMAFVGIVLSGLFIASGAGWHVFQYATEVPEGYERISYTLLQPEEGVPGQRVPPLAKELEGQKVFIKGYIYPSSQRQGLKKFLLCRDKGDCCFGGNPPPTDRILVELVGSEGLEFSTHLRSVGGVFRVKDPQRAKDAPGVVYYQLEADFWK